MGTDICGWIEIRPTVFDPVDESELFWIAVTDVGALIQRDYDAFGCLFGVRDSQGFAPVAANRGMPANASYTVRKETTRWGDMVRDLTWFGWDELKRLDWDEEAPEVDQRLYRFIRDETGILRFDDTLPWSPAESAWWLPRGEFISLGITPADLRSGQEWEVNGAVYRAVRPRRRDAVGNDWRILFKIIEALAEGSGDDGVRLVVWFFD